MSKNPIAICIAESGYGTSSFDPVTYECEHECYANIEQVILNEDYWKKYDYIMSTELWADFNLDYGFYKYKLNVYDDGSKETLKMKGRYD